MESKNPIQVADKLFLVLETLAKTGPIGLSEQNNRTPPVKFTSLHGICAAGHANIPLQLKF